MNKQFRTLTPNKMLAAIEDISKMLTAARDMETALQSALDRLVHELMVADTGILWGYEPSTDRLIAGAASGIDPNAVKQVRLNAKAGKIGRAFQTGKIELYSASVSASDAQRDIKKVFGVKIPGLDFPAAVASIPLYAETAKYGVLTFLRTGPDARFSRKDIPFFQTVTHLLALAMKMTALDKSLKEMEVIGNDDQYKAGLISTLSHEMRTPLTSIKGYSTALLMKEISYDQKTQREFLEIIGTECDLLEDLITDYLESSAINAGMMKIDLQPVRLPRLAERIADEAARRYPKHTLMVDFDGEFPLVDADPERIHQVLRQLVDNAAKYSPKGGLIFIQGKKEEDKVVVSVSDEGVGIAADDLNYLFNRFFRVRSNTGNHVIGTGLGLPISRAIVEAHGGRIWAESQLGQGSKFYFSLPLKGVIQYLED